MGIKLLFVLAVLVLVVAYRDDPIPVYDISRPIYLEWEPSSSEVEDRIVRYQIIKNYMDGWTDLDVHIPSPTYRVQMSPELIWVGVFDLGFRGCDQWWTCTDASWTRYQVVEGTIPSAPQTFRIRGM